MTTSNAPDTAVPGPASAALASPIFLGALGLLLLNDHVLKGAGVVPGWFTGKLSDFCWLVVAPVALAAMLGLRSRGALGALVLGVASLFLATELSQPLADVVAAAATALGQPTRLWADPTDLIALSILPVTWHLLARRPGATLDARRSAARLGTRVALGMAIFASVATSQPPPPAPTSWTTSAVLANTTIDPIAVRVRFAAADLDCSLLGEVDLAAAAGRDLFDTGITFRLMPQETVPIEAQAAMFAATGGPPGAMPMPANACDLVLLSIDGAPDTLVLVSGARGTAPTRLGNGAPDTVGAGHRVDVVTSAAGTPDFEVGADLPTATLDERTPPSDCTLSRAAFAHNVGSRTGSYILSTSAVGADGCIATTMSDAAGATRAFFFCVPETYFPFAPGDALTITTGGRTLTVSGPTGTLSVLDTPSSELSLGPFTVRAALHEECSGERLACGAYLLPRAVEVSARSGAVTSSPAGDFEATSSLGTARLRVGTAESTVIAPAGCDAAHSTVGPRLNAVLFTQ